MGTGRTVAGQQKEINLLQQALKLNITKTGTILYSNRGLNSTYTGAGQHSLGDEQCVGHWLDRTYNRHGLGLELVISGTNTWD